MIDVEAFLIALGALFFLGLIADIVGRYSILPRVTILILVGFGVGPDGLDWLPATVTANFPLITVMAMAMVGFLLGQGLTRRRLKALGMQILTISLSVVVLTAFVVCVGLVAFGVPLPMAFALGGIALATDPAATIDVVRECGNDTEFSEILLGVVAIDDAWCLVFFGILLGIAEGIIGEANLFASIMSGLTEIVTSMALGLGLGFPLAILSGRIRKGEPMLAEAVGGVLLTAGIAEWLDVSAILATMTLGATVANFAKHHTRPFHAIEGIEWLLLVLFFLLAGASMDIQGLKAMGAIGSVYVLLRVAGRMIGAFGGAMLAGASSYVRRWSGLTLLPQAGVAIGLALVASQRLPNYGDQILAITIGTTVFFEVVGPVATKIILGRQPGI